MAVAAPQLVADERGGICRRITENLLTGRNAMNRDPVPGGDGRLVTYRRGDPRQTGDQASDSQDPPWP
jgi:hypothetical protein